MDVLPKVLQGEKPFQTTGLPGEESSRSPTCRASSRQARVFPQNPDAKGQKKNKTTRQSFPTYTVLHGVSSVAAVVVDFERATDPKCLIGPRDIGRLYAAA